MFLISKLIQIIFGKKPKPKVEEYKHLKVKIRSLSNEQAYLIVQLFRSGMKVHEISKLFKVRPGTISAIVHGKTYREATIDLFKSNDRES